jgi:protein-glutamine gamma-glutamyltransferase
VSEDEVSAALGVTRLGALVTLLTGGLVLGLAGLLAPAVCLLCLLLILVAGLPVPHWTPWLVSTSQRRSGGALAGVLVLVFATAASGPGALASGGLQGTLAAAVAELGLPAGVPIGLLVALAAGALVAVSLELADRRGMQSALVLGTAVLGLASVAAPGRHLLPVFVIGWPAALFTLARMAGTTVTAVDSTARSTEPTMRLVPGAEGLAGRALIRWQILPVLAAVTVSCAVLAVAVLTGLTAVASQASQGGAAGVFGDHGYPRSSSDYFNGDLDLSARGPLGTQPQLEVPIDSPRLWRVGTLDLYTGLGWKATRVREELPRLVSGPADTLSLLPASGSDSASGSVSGSASDPASGPGSDSDRPRTDQARPLRPGEPQVFAPGRLISVTAESLANGRVFAEAGDRLVVPGDGSGVGHYVVHSQVLPRVDDPLAAGRLGAVSVAAGDGVADGIGTRPDKEIDQRWTALPPGVPDRVRQLGVQLVTGAPSRLAAVLAIEAELDRRMTYTLDSPPPAAGEDAVDDVLFISHSGFCEQFASAEVVLLRAAGVPARVAVGLAGGEVMDDGFRTLHRSDSHAWVEVWFPGVGWVTSDPTPAEPASTSWWKGWQNGARSLAAAPATRITGMLLLVLAVVGLLRWRRRRRSRPVDLVPAGRQVDPDLAAAFAWLEAGLGAQGRGRAATETVGALAQRLTRAEELAPGSLDQAFAVLERALYASQPPSRAECLAAAAAMRAPIDPPPQ